AVRDADSRFVRGGGRRKRSAPRFCFPWRPSRKGICPTVVLEYRAMPQNFLDCDREQAFLMPPSLRDWLPEDHLAWFVIETVGRLDLQRFYAAYRADGHGRASYEPSMMVSLVLYAYSTNERSSRGIE